MLLFPELETLSNGSVVFVSFPMSCCESVVDDSLLGILEDGEEAISGVGTSVGHDGVSITVPGFSKLPE